MKARKLSVLIIEDDLSFALELEILVQQIGYNVAAVVDNSSEALEAVYTYEVDFILMDIDIKGKLSGTEIGKRIRHLKIPILFITSFGNEQHYEEAQRSHFAGYLVKPVDPYTLRTAINLAIGNIVGKQPADTTDRSSSESLYEKYLFFKKNKVYQKVAESDVVLVEGADDYVTVFLSDGSSFLFRKTIKTLSQILFPDHFLRVHRSYLVRVTAIETIDLTALELTIANKQVPISRQKKKDLEAMIRKVE